MSPPRPPGALGLASVTAHRLTLSLSSIIFSTYGDYYFTLWGLILTLIGTGLAALKTVVTNQIQTGGGGRLRLHPLDLLMRMSPLAFIQCVMYAWYTGELERVRKYGAKEMTGTKAVGLLVNGVIAFGLNVVSFTANKKTSALTMSESTTSTCLRYLRKVLLTLLHLVRPSAVAGEHRPTLDVFTTRRAVMLTGSCRFLPVFF